MKREWKTIEGFDFKEILFEEYNHIAKITINRERYRNAFTPLTTWEMSQAFSYCREAADVRVVILTGAGDKAFCSGGDMNVKGRGGYVGTDGVPRLNVLDVQMQIRRLAKPVIAMVNGYAIGGDRKSTRLNSSHANMSDAVFCLKKKIASATPEQDEAYDRRVIEFFDRALLSNP